MKLLTVAAALVAGSLLISLPAFAEEEHAAAPEAKHEVAADQKAKDAGAKKEVKKAKKGHKKGHKAHKDAHHESEEAAKHEGTEAK